MGGTRAAALGEDGRTAELGEAGRAALATADEVADERDTVDDEDEDEDEVALAAAFLDVGEEAADDAVAVALTAASAAATAPRSERDSSEFCRRRERSRADKGGDVVASAVVLWQRR
jgi:hypothetical protein